jgi:hypothetical protein
MIISPAFSGQGLLQDPRDKRQGHSHSDVRAERQEGAGISDQGYVFEIRRNKYEDRAANLLEDAGESCTWAGEGESNL